MAFEHLNTLERAIAEAAVAKGFVSPSAKYDVRVGEGFVPEKFSFTESELAMARSLTQKRIDAVDEYPSVVRLIEFTPHVSSRAIGQLLSYGQLYPIQYPTTKKIELVLIASEDDKDLRPVLDRHGILLFLV